MNGCTNTADAIVTINSTPPAPAVNVVDNCNGTSTLTASGFTGSLLWSTNETTNSIIVNTAGTYTVNQTVSGCTSANGSGVAAPKTAPAAPGVGVVDNCNGTSTLTATGFTGSLLWSTNETTTSITVNTSGTYTVNQTVSGCTSTNGSGVAAPKTAPAAPTANSNQTFCNTPPHTVANLVATGINIQWYAASSGGSPLSSSTILVAGNYYASQTVNGCESSRTQVNVAFYPSLNAGAFNTNPVTACAGYNPPVLIIDVPSPSGGLAPYSYQWYENTNPVGTNSSSYDPPVISSAGTYDFYAAITDGCGTVVNTTTKTITIVNDPVVSISGGGPVCLNGSITLTASISGGTGAMNYQWQSGTTSTGPWTDIGGATSSTYSPPTSSTGPFYYRVILSPNVASCNNSSSTETVTVIPSPTIANAGPDQTVCAATATLAGNTATTGAGTWTLISGAGTITTPGSPTSGITGLGVGANTFRWTISNAPCASSTDDVIITRSAAPTTANAGPDQSVCATTATLAGNTATIGIGSWTLISGAGTITTPGSPTSGITGLGVGINTFRWTISNAPCGSSTDDIIITRSAAPTTANAGPDQTVCATTATLAGNTATVGTGIWTVISGTGTITTPGSPNSGITALGVGANTFRWTISNAPCTASFDEVVITRNAIPTTSNAGPDQTVCASTATLAGNTPAAGTGTWTLISGAGTITTPGSPTSGITGLGVGANTFRWTISNAPCALSTDDVIITRRATPTTANAGPDQNICGTSVTLAANNPVVGTGAWSVTSGPSTSLAQFSSTTAPNATFTAAGGAGNYVLRWTISNNPCTASFDEVTISITPPIIESSIVWEQLPTCLGNGVLFSLVGTPTGGNGTYTYQWFKKNNCGIAGTSFFIPGATGTTYVPDDNDCYWLQVSSGPCTAPLNIVSTTQRERPKSDMGGITVSAAPATICVGGSTTLSATSQVGYNYSWSPATGLNTTTGSTVIASPTVTTTYTVTGTSINDPSCSRTATITVTVRPIPTATISGTATVCQNGSSPNITFTNPQALPVTITYNINGGGNLTINVPANGTATVAAPTGTAGTFVYNLVSVAYQSGPSCSNIITGSATITVRPLPSATIAGAATVCLNDGSPVITLTNAMALPVTVTYNVNGAANTTINIGANSTATISVPTNVAGTFNYNLVNVFYQAAPSCTTSLTGTAAIIVRPLPVATISGTISVCQNGPSPNITFSNPLTLPVTATYNINGGGNLTINVPASGTATVSVPTAITGTFTYNLVSAVYQSAPLCSNPITGSATVTVDPIPTCSISGPALANAGSTGNVYTSNVLPAGGTVTYAWTIGGSGTITGPANGQTVTVTAGASGSYTLTSTVSRNGCPSTCIITVSINAATAVLSGGSTICAGSSATLTVTFTGTSPWSFTYTDGTTPVTISGINTSPFPFQVTPTVTTTYTLTGMSDANAPGTVSGTATVNVNPLPACSITGNNNVCPASTNTYSAPAGMANYSWSISGNGTISGATNLQNVSVIASGTCGTYTLTLTITDGNGCINTCNQTYTISDNINPTISLTPSRLPGL